MKFYCGIDLSARDCHVCVIDEQLQIMDQHFLGTKV
jgi:predicted nuclease with RNAse H fold